MQIDSNFSHRLLLAGRQGGGSTESLKPSGAPRIPNYNCCHAFILAQAFSNSPPPWLQGICRFFTICIDTLESCLFAHKDSAAMISFASCKSAARMLAL